MKPRRKRRQHKDVFFFFLRMYFADFCSIPWEVLWSALQNYLPGWTMWWEHPGMGRADQMSVFNGEKEVVWLYEQMALGKVVHGQWLQTTPILLPLRLRAPWFFFTRYWLSQSSKHLPSLESLWQFTYVTKSLQGDSWKPRLNGDC